MLSDSIKQLVDSHDVISFDIFDTLLVRPYIVPEDLFKHLAFLEKDDDFVLNRKEAEKKARQHFREYEDITLKEIYDFIPQKYKSYMEKELALERLVLSPHPHIKEIYDYALQHHKKIIITSDMYLPKDFVQNVLHENGYTGYQHLFLSSEYRHLKYRGHLYQDVLNTLKIPPKKILHIGDHKEKDKVAPKKLGIDTILIPKMIDQFMENKFISCLVKKYANNIHFSVIMGLSALYAHNKSKNYWDRFGYSIAAPICLAFVTWINRDIIKHHIKDAIFIARDGYILKTIMDQINHNLNTHYVYAPRSLNLICQLNYKKTGKFVYDHTKTIINFYKKKSQKLANLPEIKTAEEGLNILSEHKTVFEDLARKEYDSYKKYLQNLHLGENVATVDSVSLFFSAQKVFQTVFPNKTFRGYYYLIQKGGDLTHKTVLSYTPVSEYTDPMKLIEFIMSAPEPPIDFIENAQPVYKTITPVEQKRIDVCNQFSKVAFDFVKDYKKLFPTGYLDCPSTVISDIIHTFIAHPAAEDITAFSKILFAYDSQHAKYVPIFKKWKYKKMLYDFFHSIFLKKKK